MHCKEQGLKVHLIIKECLLSTCTLLVAIANVFRYVHNWSFDYTLTTTETTATKILQIDTKYQLFGIFKSNHCYEPQLVETLAKKNILAC